MSTEIVIRRPRAEVAAYAADPDNAPAWYANIKSVEWAGAKRLAAGARVAFVAHFLGRVLRYTYEIREYQPAVRLVQSTSDGAFPMETTYEWADAGADATRMTLRNRGNPTAFAGMSAPLLAFFMRRANRKDLKRLKAILEAGRAA